MKSGSWSAYRAATDPEVWCGGTPDDAEPPMWTCPQCGGKGCILVRVGFPGDDLVGHHEECDICHGRGEVNWNPADGNPK